MQNTSITVFSRLLMLLVITLSMIAAPASFAQRHAERIAPIIFYLLSESGPTFSEPSITNIQPFSFSHGDTVTLTGSGFGNKVNAKPLLWVDFNENIQPSSTNSQRTSWGGGLNAGAEVSSDNPAPNATQSFRFDLSTTYGASLGLYDIRDAIGERTQRLYMFARKYYGFDIVDDKGANGFNLKMYRFWGDQSNVPEDRNNIFWGYQGNEGLTSGRMTAEYTDGNRYSSIIGQEEGEWMVHELIYDAGTINVQNGLYDIYQDGVKWINDVYNFETHSSQLPNKYEDFFFEQVSNGTGTGPIYIYYDEIYMDTTYQRVIICDADTFESCNERAIQLPTAWSDNSITIKLNQGAFTSFNQPLWLYVFNAEGKPNTNGIALQ